MNPADENVRGSADDGSILLTVMHKKDCNVNNKKKIQIPCPLRNNYMLPVTSKKA
jgi:hypothetical protein